MKKFYLFLTTLLLCAFVGSAQDLSGLFGGGTGTADDPYIISTRTHVENLALYGQQITDYSGLYFKMVNDIDFTGAQVWGVGESNRPFSGTFDGEGHRFINVTVAVPVFAYIGQKGVVKNFTVYAPQATGSATSNNTAFVAGMVLGLLQDCHVVNATQNFTATGQNYVNAGVAAYVTQTGVVRNCSYTGTVTTACGFGPIAGRVMGGTLVNCTSSAVINVARTNINVGGVASTTQWMQNGATYNYDGCVFDGTITMTTPYSNVSIGGIAGYGFPAKFTGCVNSGTIIGLGYTGGIAGQASNNSSFDNCYNIGSVQDYYMATDLIPESFGMSDYVAGILGFSGGATMNCCWNGGTVKSLRCAAGLVGTTGATGSDLTLNNCYNAGLIIGPYTWISGSTTMEKTGGLVAELSGVFSLKMNNCLSFGTIVNAAIARYADSEFLGYTLTPDKVSYQNCYYDSQVAGYGSQVGPKTTAELTSGTPLEGFDATDTWIFTEGLYPRLRASAESSAAKLCATPYLLADGDVHNKVNNDFTVSAANGVTWTLSDNNSATLNANTVNVDRGTKAETVTLTASLGNAIHQSQVVINPDIFDGEGTAENPYQIKTYEDLKNFAAATNDGALDFNGEYIVLMNDIDCESDATFERISQSTPFNGTFNGNGHSLNNLTMNLHSDEVGKSGLFGYVGKNAVVKNLTIGASSTIGLGLNCGTIAASVKGRIENCRVLTPTISTTASRGSFGGIAGTVEIGGEVVDCYVASAITLPASTNNVAGIVAFNYGTVDGCQYANSLIGTTSNYLGGIVSHNYGLIDNCIASGTVSANRYVGGIAARCLPQGTLMPEIRNSLSTAIVSYVDDVTHAGAVVGEKYGTLSNVVYDKQVSILDNVNDVGLAAKLTREIVADGAFSPKFTASEGNYPVVAKFAQEPAVMMTMKPILWSDNDTRLNMTRNTSVNLPQMQGIAYSLSDGDGDFTLNTANLTLTYNGGTSYAQDIIVQTYQGITRQIMVAGMGQFLDGTGAEDDPYIIDSEEKLRKLATEMAKTDNKNTFTGKHFKFTADITMTDTAMPSIAGGNAKSFRGTIHGDGHFISNLNISGGAYTALVGNLGNGGKIENLTIESGSVSGSQYVGAFAGYLNGASLVNVTNKASVNGSNTYVGGIVGRAVNALELTQLTNNGNVTNKANYTGGVAGAIETPVAQVSTLSNTGNVVGAMYTGGVAGYAYGNSYTNLQNSGTVTGSNATTNMLGGIMGVADACTLISNARNLGDVSASATAGIGGVVGRYWPSKNTSNTLSITDSFNAGAITSTNAKATNIGGIVGMADTYSLTVQRCANVAPIVNQATTVAVGSPAAGGIVGGGAPIIEDCFNAGAIAGLNCIGGILGRPVNNDAVVTLRNNLNVGWLEGFATASTNIGAICGYKSTGAVFEGNVYDKQMCEIAAVGKTDVEGNEGQFSVLIKNPLSNNWTVVNKRYPQINSLIDQPAVAVATLPIYLNKDDLRSNVTTLFSVATGDAYTWGGDSIFAVRDGNVSIVGDFNDGDLITGDYLLTVSDGLYSHPVKLTLNYVYSSSVKGDVNCDGNIDARDVTMLINYILGNSVEPFDNIAADVNNDSDINALDVTALIAIILNN